MRYTLSQGFHHACPSLEMSSILWGLPQGRVGCMQTLAAKAAAMIATRADSHEVTVADAGRAGQVWKALQILNLLQQHLQVDLTHHFYG